MSALTIPFIVKTSNPLLTYSLLTIVVAAIGFVAYLLIRHHRGHRKAEKLGYDRRHDGQHGNH